MYVYASELRKSWQFYILKLLFLSIFCRYIHWQITCNIPWLNFIWGQAPPQAPPPLPTSTPVIIGVGGGGGGRGGTVPPKKI